MIIALEKDIDIQSDFESCWELILEILVGSGLVLCWREELGDRYQLVHDYLVKPIRKKNDRGIIAELEKIKSEKTKAEVAQKLSQEHLNAVLQRRLREARAAGIMLAVMGGTIASLWWQADMQKKAAELQTLRAETSETNLQISVIAASSEALFSSNKEFDALLESLRAWQKLKQAKEVNPEKQMRVVTALQQAVYGVTELNRLEGQTDIVWGVAFSPDGQLLASGSTDKTLKIWRSDGTLPQTLEGHTSAVTSVAFSPDNKMLASGSYDKSVKLWSLAAPTLPVLQGHEDRVLSIAWSPDGQILASGSRDRTVRLWRRELGKGKLDAHIYKVLEDHTAMVHSVSIDPKGEILASASEDKTIKLWRLDCSLLKTLPGHTDAVISVNFSPDGSLIASASRDNTVKLWNRDGSLLKTLVGHKARVNSVSFSPDGEILASASNDKTIKLWRADGSLIKTLAPHDSWYLVLALAPLNNC
ncbi:WD-40 repeat protein [Nostoc sp. NIES-3756]|nr:WD-40 repeat protein [Nostoc sp. NIES-3756]